MSQAFTQSVGDDLDYIVDWTDWLSGATIASSAWSVPSGLSGHDAIYDNTSATIWLTGGGENDRFEIRNTITDSAGRNKTWSVYLRIGEQ